MNLRRSAPFSQQQGYLTIAQNSNDVDYLRLAYLQALSVKATQKINNYAVVVDSHTAKQVTYLHRQVFDHVIELPFDDMAEHVDWKLQNEWQVWWATPFKETIKLESDLLLTVPQDHWWHMLRHREVCFSVVARDYRNAVSNSRMYRTAFDENNLPNAYNGFSYFRYSKTSADFFVALKNIFENTDMVKSNLSYCNKIATDEAYAVAANIIGEEKCFLPHTDYPCLTHMKPGIHNWHKDTNWLDVLPYTLDQDGSITVGGYRQLYPFHYYEKEFATDKVISHYEQLVF